jgi:hypothetical protein
MSSSMNMDRAKAYRWTALSLLLLAATDVFVLDSLAAFRCDQFEQTGSETSSATDECFCCCGHIVIPPAIQPPAMPSPVMLYFAPGLARPSVVSTPLYHPPRA